MLDQQLDIFMMRISFPVKSFEKILNQSLARLSSTCVILSLTVVIFGSAVQPVAKECFAKFLL